MEQQGTDTYAIKPVQRYVRPEDTLDPPYRNLQNYPGKLGRLLPPPLNFVGRKAFQQPYPDVITLRPAGISGVYAYTGPVLQAYGIEPKNQL